MWRLWTRGWGPRDWWHWFHREGFPLWVACHLPKRVTFWAFVLVSGATGQAPGAEYARDADYWCQKHGL